MNKNKTNKPDIILKGGNGEHRISHKTWNTLCQKYNIPFDSKPKYLSNGAQQTVYEFGPNYVLKISCMDFVIKTAKKLRGRNIPHVARCFSVIKAVPSDKNDQWYCIVQERCENGKGGYNFMALMSQMFAEKSVTVDMLRSVTALRKLGLQSIVDFQDANAMRNANDAIVVSDFGCLRF